MENVPTISKEALFHILREGDSGVAVDGDVCHPAEVSDFF
jgi:hypothetical protein